MRTLGFIPVIKGIHRTENPGAQAEAETSLRLTLYPSPPWLPVLPWGARLYLAACEVFYALEERGVPELERLARTSDCGLGLSAFQILCLLGIDGVCPERIGQFLPQLLDNRADDDLEFLMPVIGRFCACSLEMSNGVLTFLKSVGATDPIEELEYLLQLQSHAPELVKNRTDTLEEMLLDSGPAPRHTLMAVHTPENPHLVIGKTIFPRVPDIHAIRAALAIITLDPTLTEVLSAIQYWSSEHPIVEFRKEIHEHFRVDWASFESRERPRRFPEWDDLKYNFVKDGALLDIHIVDMEPAAYPSFFAFIKSRMDHITYLVEEESQELPSTFEEYNFNALENGATLHMSFGKFDFNCNSYGTDEIELDFWPDSATKQNFPDFLDLLADLGRAVSKDIKVTFEGSLSPFLCYCHRTDFLFQVPENLLKETDIPQEELDELRQRDKSGQR